jgi:hypothetical protein
MIGGVFGMYGTFWSIYWKYWADRRKENDKRAK